MIRLRIAPSPTGYPHIGSIWQALINFAFAKKNKGKFIVRIEDTDRNRYVPDAEEKLFKALKWFGLEPDESPIHGGKYGPYRQSERLALYKKYAQDLIKIGGAYYCFCSKEKLAKARDEMIKHAKIPMYNGHCRNINPQEAQKRAANGEPFVIRLKVPKNKTIIVNDLLRGEIKFDSNMVDDQVLLKSDGYPTYQLAVVVDDHLMQITHMIRGEEWISSAPKPILIYEYFGWKQPIFVHTPLLRNPDKSKLSKRQGHTDVSWYQDNGYLPQAIINFLALLGWSHPQEKIIFPLSEFIELFDLKDLSPAGPIVDLKKLDYFNGVYLRNTPDKKIIQLITPYLKIWKLEIARPRPSRGEAGENCKLEKIVPLVKERITKLTDVEFLIDFFVKDIVYDKSLLISKAEIELVRKQLSAISNQLLAISHWDLPTITKAMQTLCESHKWNRSQFFMLLRVAVTGKTITPPLFESMEILGKTKTLQKINIALNKLK